MKHFRLLMTVLAVFLGLGANAQTWKGNNVAAGTFYFYNIGSGMWLCGGNDWGTHASVTEKGGLDITLEGADGVFTLDTKLSNGGTSHYLNGDYMDGGPQNWTFTQVSRSDGVIAYIISNGNGNLCKGDGTYAYVDTEKGTSEYAQWVLVTYDERLAALASASESNPMDASFLIKANTISRNDQRNNSSWQGGITIGGYGSVEGSNMCIERYNTTFDVYQEITGVPDGKYRLSVEGFYRYGGDGIAPAVEARNNGTEEIYAYYYVGTGEAKLKSIFDGADAITNGISSDYGVVPNTLEQAARFISAGAYQNPEIEGVVMNGTLRVGVKKETAVSRDWTAFDTFILTYLGPVQDLTPYIEAYEKALANAKAAAATTDKVAPTWLAALNNSISTYDKGKVNENSKDALVAATAALNDATAVVNASIASYKTIANGEVPTNSVDGWVCTNQQQFHVNTWSHEGDSDGSGMTIPFIENWIGAANVLGDGMVYYCLEGLEPGEIYYAQSLVRVYSEAGNTPNGPIFFVNDAETDMTEAGTPLSFNGNGGYFGTLGASAVVGADGKLTLGVKISGANYNWVAFKNVKIQSLSDALKDAYDKVKAYSGKVTAASQSEIDNIESTTAANFNLNTVAGIEAAIQALTAKAEELAGVAAAYAEFQTIYPQVKALADVADYKELKANAHKTLENKLKNLANNVEQANTADAVRAVNASLREAGATYANNAEPTGTAVFNLTFMLINPNLEALANGQQAEGWYTDQNGGNSQVMRNADATSEDGTKTAFFEYWSNEPAANNLFTLYQKVDLGTGIFKMSCYAFAQQPIGGDVRGVKFFANDIEGSTIKTNRLSEANIEFVHNESGEVKIGLKAVTGNTYRWMGIGYVELYKLPSEKEAAIADNDTQAPQAGAYTAIKANVKMLKGLNTIVLPFATTQEEIGAAQVLEYNGSEEVDGKIRLKFTEVTALAANIPYAVFYDANTSLPNFEDKTVAEVTDLTVADTEYSFVGTYTAYAKGSSPIAAGDYIAGVKDFTKATGKNGINAYRAYMKKVGDSAGALEFDFNGTIVDGIEAVEIARSLSGTIFNLNGQRVNITQKGVYIIDGQKVVIK